MPPKHNQSWSGQQQNRGGRGFHRGHWNGRGRQFHHQNKRQFQDDEVAEQNVSFDMHSLFISQCIMTHECMNVSSHFRMHRRSLQSLRSLSPLLKNRLPSSKSSRSMRSAEKNSHNSNSSNINHLLPKAFQCQPRAPSHPPRMWLRRPHSCIPQQPLRRKCQFRPLFPCQQI